MDGFLPSLTQSRPATRKKGVSIATQLRHRHFLSCPNRVFFGFSAVHVRSNSHACFVSCCLRTISLREIFEPDESHLFRPLTCFFFASVLALSFLLPSRARTQSCSKTTRRRATMLRNGGRNRRGSTCTPSLNSKVNWRELHCKAWEPHVEEKMEEQVVECMGRCPTRNKERGRRWAGHLPRSSMTETCNKR